MPVLLDELTGGDQGLQEVAAELRQQVPPLPPAYWQALAKVTKRAVPPMRLACEVPNYSPGSARIHVERMPHRNSMAVPGESGVAYVLLKLIPAGLNGAAKPLG